jgi:hypothetical protein
LRAGALGGEVVGDIDQTRSPIVQDTTVEAAVLRQLLALYPVQLTLTELVREISDGAADFAATDPVERAVGRLSAAGLIHRSGDMVIPSRAALRSYELLE